VLNVKIGTSANGQSVFKHHKIFLDGATGIALKSIDQDFLLVGILDAKGRPSFTQKWPWDKVFSI
jgi:hypothetical protein